MPLLLHNQGPYWARPTIAAPKPAALSVVSQPELRQVLTDCRNQARFSVIIRRLGSSAEGMLDLGTRSRSFGSARATLLADAAMRYFNS
jgi:hypothetical protein